MDMPNILSKLSSKEKNQEQFLAVEIGSETVSTALWQIIENKTKIISIGTSEDWEDSEKHENLLSAIDTSLSKASEEVEGEPSKVIFGLQESWVDEEAIEKQQAKILLLK